MGIRPIRLRCRVRRVQAQWKRRQLRARVPYDREGKRLRFHGISDAMTVEGTASLSQSQPFPLTTCQGLQVRWNDDAGLHALPERMDEQVSHALPPRLDSPLARIAQESPARVIVDRFRLMPLASYSLDARIELMRRARHSLDIQY